MKSKTNEALIEKTVKYYGTDLITQKRCPNCLKLISESCPTRPLDYIVNWKRMLKCDCKNKRKVV
jgi:hypothetical protein